MTSELKGRFHDVFHDVFMINMMSAHGANTIFFKKWMYRTLANPTPTSDSISFLPYFSTSTPLKVDGICLSSLLCQHNQELSITILLEKLADGRISIKNETNSLYLIPNIASLSKKNKIFDWKNRIFSRKIYSI